MARRGNHLAHLVRAYAEAKGLGVRSAQLHCKHEDPRWVEFLRVAGWNVDGTKAEAEARMEIVAAAGFEADEPIEHQMEREHRALWREAVEAAKRATASGHASSAGHFAKLAREQLAACEAATRARVKADLLRRELIPAGEWENLMEMVRRIASLITGIDRELADKTNPENPAVSALALRDWLENRWNPALAALEAVA